MSRQRGELLIPELGVIAHPTSRLLQRLRRQAAHHRASDLFADNERSVLEKHQMLRYSRQRHRHRRGQLSHCRLALGQACEDRTPRWVGQGEEGNIE